MKVRLFSSQKPYSAMKVWVWLPTGWKPFGAAVLEKAHNHF
ncbi:hypothetical protein [Candidatus Leptofilum sp.]